MDFPMLISTASLKAIYSVSASWKLYHLVTLSQAEIYAEIGEVVNGRKPAKRGRATVFKSLGKFHLYIWGCVSLVCFDRGYEFMAFPIPKSKNCFTWDITSRQTLWRNCYNWITSCPVFMSKGKQIALACIQFTGLSTFCKKHTLSSMKLLRFVGARTQQYRLPIHIFLSMVSAWHNYIEYNQYNQLCMPSLFFCK